MDSVRGHLRRLLNSRHGLSEAMPDYGLPALTDMTVGSRDYAHAIQEAIRVAVEKYEPRLDRVRVTRVVDEDSPHLHRSHRQEMGPAHPVCLPLVHQTHVGFMDKGRRLEGMVDSLPAHLGLGKPTEIFVDQGHEFAQRVLASSAGFSQQSGDCPFRILNQRPPDSGISRREIFRLLFLSAFSALSRV